MVAPRRGGCNDCPWKKRHRCASRGRLDPAAHAAVASLIPRNRPEQGTSEAGRRRPDRLARRREPRLDVQIQFHSCPLKQAGLDAGLAQEEVAGLCRIASEVDRGLFEGAGFRFHADTYRPGAEGCCFLHVRPGV
jgi:hypothetical protein